jgi:hypothetical protein
LHLYIISNYNFKQSYLWVCQWLATGQWFSSGTAVSSTNKTDYHDITEILLKVALNTITLTLFTKILLKKIIKIYNSWYMYSIFWILNFYFFYSFHFKINHNLHDFTMFQILVYDSKEIGVVLKIFCHGEKLNFPWIGE